MKERIDKAIDKATGFGLTDISIALDHEDWTSFADDMEKLTGLRLKGTQTYRGASVYKADGFNKFSPRASGRFDV